MCGTCGVSQDCRRSAPARHVTGCGRTRSDEDLDRSLTAVDTRESESHRREMLRLFLQACRFLTTCDFGPHGILTTSSGVTRPVMRGHFGY
jgi:hypothetical protein